MSLFEDVVVNTKSAIDAFGKKAGELVDTSKLKINAVELNNEISKKFEVIGRSVYDSKKSENNVISVEDKIIEEIDELYKKLDLINDQIASMKKKIKCKECGFINIEDSIYCCKCGSKFSEQKEQKVDSEEIEVEVKEHKENKAKEKATKVTKSRTKSSNKSDTKKDINS